MVAGPRAQTRVTYVMCRSWRIATPVMREMMLKNNAVRVALAVIAAFYVVTGGLWAADYFPLQKYYAQKEVQDRLLDELGFDRAFDSEEFKRASAYQETYAVSRPSIIHTENKLAFLRSIIFWATVALGVGGGVLVATRRGPKGPATTTGSD